MLQVQKNKQKIWVLKRNAIQALSVSANTACLFSSPVISDISTAGLQAAPLLQHQALLLQWDHISHIREVYSVRLLLELIVGVWARYLPVRPDERCCAWPAVWSHLTAGTSAGWWELSRGRHAHINEIIWSVVYQQSHTAAVYFPQCVSLLRQIMEHRRGGNLSTPNQVILWASIEENKGHKRNQNVHKQKTVLKTLPQAGTTTCWKQISTSIAFIWLTFALQSYFMVCYYHHQGERLSVIQGIKLIIGLIRGIWILMRRWGH